MIMSRWGIPILSLTTDGMYSTFNPENAEPVTQAVNLRLELSGLNRRKLTACVTESDCY